jgi:hypothetical protein
VLHQSGPTGHLPGGPVIAHLSHAPPGVYEEPYGWAILKTVGPNYTHPVMVRGHDLFDYHTPLLIQFTEAPPTADAELDPQHPDHSVSVVGEGWAKWGTHTHQAKPPLADQVPATVDRYWDVSCAG